MNAAEDRENRAGLNNEPIEVRAEGKSAERKAGHERTGLKVDE